LCVLVGIGRPNNPSAAADADDGWVLPTSRLPWPSL
jgi:hypothetical protein